MVLGNYVPRLNLFRILLYLPSEWKYFNVNDLIKKLMLGKPKNLIER